MLFVLLTELLIGVSSMGFCEDLSEEQEKEILNIEHQIDILKRQKENMKNKTTDENYETLYPLIQKIDKNIESLEKGLSPKSPKKQLKKRIELLKKRYSQLHDREILNPTTNGQQSLQKILNKIYTLEAEYEEKYFDEDEDEEY